MGEIIPFKGPTREDKKEGGKEKGSGIQKGDYCTFTREVSEKSKIPDRFVPENRRAMTKTQTYKGGEIVGCDKEKGEVIFRVKKIVGDVIIDVDLHVSNKEMEGLIDEVIKNYKHVKIFEKGKKYYFDQMSIPTREGELIVGFAVFLGEISNKRGVACNEFKDAQSESRFSIEIPPAKVSGGDNSQNRVIQFPLPRKE